MVHCGQVKTRCPLQRVRTSVAPPAPSSMMTSAASLLPDVRRLGIATPDERSLARAAQGGSGGKGAGKHRRASGGGRARLAMRVLCRCVGDQVRSFLSCVCVNNHSKLVFLLVSSIAARWASSACFAALRAARSANLCSLCRSRCAHRGGWQRTSREWGVAAAGSTAAATAAGGAAAGRRRHGADAALRAASLASHRPMERGQHAGGVPAPYPFAAQASSGPAVLSHPPAPSWPASAGDRSQGQSGSNRPAALAGGSGAGSAGACAQSRPRCFGAGSGAGSEPADGAGCGCRPRGLCALDGCTAR